MPSHHLPKGSLGFGDMMTLNQVVLLVFGGSLGLPESLLSIDLLRRPAEDARK